MTGYFLGKKKGMTIKEIVPFKIKIHVDNFD